MGGHAWYTCMRDYCGQPLAVRMRPPSAVEATRAQYTYLFVATIELATVMGNGLPDADYNEGLINVDLDIVRQVEANGTVVVVETFAGKRSYYAYVRAREAAEAVVKQSLLTHGRAEQYCFRGGDDREWKFYDGYLREIDFEVL